MKLLYLGLMLVAATSAQNASTSCPCGWTNKGRIVGGKEAKVNEYPWVGAMAIVAEGEALTFCGATILTPSHALTAAHCTQGEIVQYLPYLQLLVGVHSIKSWASKAQAVKIERFIDHERFEQNDAEGKKNANDISLVVLEQRIKFSPNVGPACLPTGPLNLEASYVKVLGWGQKKTDGESSDVLREVDLRVIPFKKCASFFPLTQKPTQICTFAKNKDSCRGDSGGPVIWMDPETYRYTLVGLVSYGSKDCGSKPAVNTDVSRYVGWIQAKISESGKSGTTCQKTKLRNLLHRRKI